MRKFSIMSECLFFNDQLSKKFTAKEREDMKRRYCGGGSSQCARYIVAQALGLHGKSVKNSPISWFSCPRTSHLKGLLSR